MIIGDNFFYGHSLIENIKNYIKQNKPTIFVKKVEQSIFIWCGSTSGKKKLNKVIEKPKILKEIILQ